MSIFFFGYEGNFILIGSTFSEYASDGDEGSTEDLGSTFGGFTGDGDGGNW